MADRIPAHIATHDRRAIEALTQRLLREFGSDVLSVTVFGSKARGDDTPHSDIDVLLVVANENWRVKHQIRTLGARVSLDHDVLFNLYIVEREQWVWMQEINHPLYRRVASEGVELVPATVMNEKWSAWVYSPLSGCPGSQAQWP